MEKATPDEKMKTLLEANKDSLDRIKRTKDTWVKIDERGDIPPVVIVEKNGEDLCTVFAPQVDKMMGLRAAQVLRQGFDPDYMTVMFDAHYAQGKKDESEEEFAERFPAGSMQKMCDEENACAVGLITDCIISARVGRNGKLLMINLPYSYHGKGSDFIWYDDKATISDENDPESEATFSGHIPSALKSIMAEKSLLESSELRSRLDALQKLAAETDLPDAPPELKELLDKVRDTPDLNLWELFGLDRETAQLHAGRAALTSLMHKGFHALVGETVMMDGRGFADPSVQAYPLHEVK
jgi:hypothetical protein